LEHKESAKVPEGLDLLEYYTRIYKWYRKNIALVLKNYRGNNPDHHKKSNKIIENMPEPHLAKKEDIVFVCREVTSHYLEWGAMEIDQNNVWMSAYAQYLLNNFFPKENLEELGKKSKLFSLLTTK
jgi:hypothetical protein